MTTEPGRHLATATPPAVTTQSAPPAPGTSSAPTATDPTARPLWLVDFDGVVNAVTRKPMRSAWPDWVFVEVPDGRGRTWPVWYSPTVIAFIADVARAGVEVMWLSTWGGITETFPDVFPGLPALGHISPPPDLDQGDGWGSPPDGDNGPLWWKHREAARAAGNRPLIWTDDDLAGYAHPARAARSWADRRAHTLVVAPKVSLGLSPRPLKDMRRFLQDLGHDLGAPAD